MSEKIDYARIAWRCIEKLTSEFVSNPYNFFSESDVKCRLYDMMFEYPQINMLKKTIDGARIYPLHSEVTYFDHEGNLMFHVDLSAIEPTEANVYSKPRAGELKFSKGYSAPECIFAIELKLNKRSKKERMLKLWKKDMEKLDDILNRNPSLACFCILLDKMDRVSEQSELTSIAVNYNRVRIIYANKKGAVFFFNIGNQSAALQS